jgi:hypothetical protein
MYIVTCLVTIHGVWIGNWIYWTLIDRNFKYSALANPRNRLLTIAHTKSSRFVFTSRCYVTDANNVKVKVKQAANDSSKLLLACSLVS